MFDVPAATDASSRTAVHAHHAFLLTFSLAGTFSLHLHDRVLAGPGALVAPDAPHAFEARGLVGLLFVEPESHAGRSLPQMTDGQPAAAIGAEQARDAPSLIKSAFEHPTDRGNALRATGMQICRRITGHVRGREPDRRVRVMIRWVSENLDASPGIHEAADRVGLSPNRASHLFVEQTGGPASGPVVRDIEADLVERVTLAEQTRVYHFDDATSAWEIGRLLDDHGDSQLVQFPTE